MKQIFMIYTPPEYPKGIGDNMKNCLTHNIISDKSSKDDIWSQHNIEIHNVPEELKIHTQKNNVASLLSEKPVYWDYEFKHIILPNNYRLEMGCECGTNIDMGSFTLYIDDAPVKTLSYF